MKKISALFYITLPAMIAISSPGLGASTLESENPEAGLVYNTNVSASPSFSILDTVSDDYLDYRDYVITTAIYQPSLFLNKFDQHGKFRSVINSYELPDTLSAEDLISFTLGQSEHHSSIDRKRGGGVTGFYNPFLDFWMMLSFDSSGQIEDVGIVSGEEFRGDTISIPEGFLLSRRNKNGFETIGEIIATFRRESVWAFYDLDDPVHIKRVSNLSVEKMNLLKKRLLVMKQETGDVFQKQALYERTKSIINHMEKEGNVPAEFIFPVNKKKIENELRHIVALEQINHEVVMYLPTQTGWLVVSRSKEYADVMISFLYKITDTGDIILQNTRFEHL